VAATVLAGLVRRGHSVTALAPTWGRRASRSTTGARRGRGFPVTWYPVPEQPSDGFAPTSAESREADRRLMETWLAPLLAARRPDVVVLGRERLVWHVPRIARRHGIPTVMLGQGATGARALARVYTPPLDRAFLARCRGLALIIAVARHLGEDLRRLGLDRIRVIPNPVDLRRFAPRPKDPVLLEALGIRTDDIVVMYVSALKPMKRPLDVVAAAERALPENARLVYVVVGDGECRSGMEAACRRAGLDGRFRFVGWVRHGRMPAHLALADVVVLTSEHEAQSLACLEAQASGRLILASDIPGAREIIRDGQTGLLFRTGDVAALAAKTLAAAADSSLRDTVARRARLQVRTHAADRIVAAYADALLDVVAGAGRGGPASAPDPARCPEGPAPSMP
jgi:glycosyltransferase involved in cell wall biosynthesis